MGKINTNNYPNRPVSAYQDDDMFILQDNGGETYTTNVGDIKTLIDNRVNDSNLVHKTGDETILGNKTFEDDINVEGGITAGTTSTFNDIDLDGSSISGVSTLNVNQIDVHDGQAVEFLTGITVYGDVTDENGNVLSNKTDKVTNATSGHLAGLDANGNLTDSGVSLFADKTVGFAPVVTCDNAIPINAKKVTAKINAVQDLHGLPFPYVGGAYKNLLDPTEMTTTATNIKFYADNEKSFEAGTYTLSIAAVVNGLYVNTASETLFSATNASSLTFTLSESTAVNFSFYNGSGIDPTLNCQLEKGSQATTWTPYSNICPISGFSAVEVTQKDDADNPTVTETHTLTLSSTNYGGSADNVGNEEKTFGMVDLGTLDWTYAPSWNGHPAFYTHGIKNLVKIPPVAIAVNANCEIYEVMSRDSLYALDGYGLAISGDGALDIRDYRYSDELDFKNALSGVKLAYELATPTTANITPVPIQMLKGKNVFSADSGDTQVEYTYDRIGDLVDRVKALEDA